MSMTKPPLQAVPSTKFEAEVRAKDGSITKREMNVRVIQVPKVARTPKRNQKHTIQRQTQQGQQTSNITPLEDRQAAYGNLIEAPYDQHALVILEEESNILRECVDAMVMNIEGHGNLYRPRKVTPKTYRTHKTEIDMERIRLDGWLDVLCPDISFIESRKRMRRDLELTGNGYWEIVRDSTKKIIEINHVQSYRMRLSKQDKTSTPYQIPVISPEDDYQIKTLDKQKRFRRYAQLDSSGAPSVWFKEFGDPRKIDKRTGLVAKETEGGQDLDIANEATEIIHFKIYSARSVYGIPRYIGRYVSIIGSRRSEEVNYFTLSNNYVPSMFIMVENGELTDSTISRLTELIESQVSTDPNYSKIVIVEASNAADESFPGQISGAKLSMFEPRSQKTDQMFQEYDQNNQNKARQAFRLPPLMVGRSEDYTRATAQASLKMADEQVFHPERTVVDSIMLRIMLDQGFRWHTFKSRTPNITDNETLTRAMVAAEKSGAMTPLRANTLMEDIFEGELGPLPDGIDIKVPYSLQFALAQKGQVAAPSEMGPGQVGTVEREDLDWTTEYIDEILRGLD